mmetsp:Transcript_21404/g.56684  ORF Transcript_21404/g.56684 Transcript_21404/m.56684 type:complete len:285 (+) Transcript_21404:687-1541(+)
MVRPGLVHVRPNRGLDAERGPSVCRVRPKHTDGADLRTVAGIAARPAMSAPECRGVGRLGRALELDRLASGSAHRARVRGVEAVGEVAAEVLDAEARCAARLVRNPGLPDSPVAQEPLASRGLGRLVRERGTSQDYVPEDLVDHGRRDAQVRDQLEDAVGDFVQVLVHPLAQIEPHRLRALVVPRPLLRLVLGEDDQLRGEVPEEGRVWLPRVGCKLPGVLLQRGALVSLERGNRHGHVEDGGLLHELVQAPPFASRDQGDAPRGVAPAGGGQPPLARAVAPAA